MQDTDHQTQLVFTVLTAACLLVVLAFGIYWFNAQNLPHNFHGWQHGFDLMLFAAVTYVVWLPIIMKVTLWSIASHITPVDHPTPPPGLNVALITTFVPRSESASLLHTTLPAMCAAQYPHDTWLLDEGDDDEVRQICHQYGVRHFSRNGKAHYNTEHGKFARRTKGGNHNSWYDTVGNHYDIVAQMDTDFVASRDFLTKTLGYFNDPQVAFVGTPQVYGNIHQSLIARGAAEQTYSFYGPILRGMAGMNTTMLIGANHVIRVKALQHVDHYSAHITEDLLTGMKLHAEGWKSIYVPEVLAIGEGPTTWPAYFAQQKRWAYGCMHILFNHSFRLFQLMTLRRILYYFLLQQHYFGGLAMFISVCCLGLYYGFGFQTTQLQFADFMVLYGAVIVINTFMDRWLQRFNIRPKKEKGMLWAGMYMSIVAWPIYLTAFFALFKTKAMAYRVTPKGKTAPKRRQPLPIHLFVPHGLLAVVALGCFVSSFFTHRTALVMDFWALVTGVLLLVVPFMPVIAAGLKRLFSRSNLYNQST